MLVKCKCCGNKIERDIAFKIVINNKNNYYCSEIEYKKMETEKQNKAHVYSLIDEIFGYKIINTVINKEISIISKENTYEKVYKYLLENKQYLEKVMNRSFDNEYGKIKYFSTIIRNNIKDYKCIANKENNESFNVENVKTVYKPIKHKKTLEEYMEEYING